jgi:hypothetical protein
MPGGRLGSNSSSSGYFNASGESTPEAPVPTEFIPMARTTSRINDALAIPPDWNGNVRRQPIVQRAERVTGMKYLYVRGTVPMPIHPLGADGTPLPWNSSFQKLDFAPIHNAGFNYALFQAGYPGFNLGLSFKVPTAPSELRATTGPGYAMRENGPKSNKGGSRGTQTVRRTLGR